LILTPNFIDLPAEEGQFDMIGAIVTTAVFAVLASSLATIGNFAIARDFPGYEPDWESDGLVDSAVVFRFMQYRMMANIFHYQSLVLWSLLVILLAYKLLLSVQ
jgi:hypothetical protein